MRHHPRIGYTFIPGLRRFCNGVGGKFLLRTNALGFRSDYEFAAHEDAGARRALLFGDSQAAGEGVSNPKRFSDLIEKRIDALKIYNFALTGTGTDQQFVAFCEFAPTLRHELLVLCIFVENIERIHRRVLAWPDPEGRPQLYGKPYFKVMSGEIKLHGVPVPERPWTMETLPDELRDDLAISATAASTVRAQIQRVVPLRLRRVVVPALRRVVRRRALPAYDRPDNPQWILMREILTAWIKKSSSPVLLVPLPAMHFLFEPNDARPCQARFTELARSTGATLHDPLPQLWGLSNEDRRAFWNPDSGHITEFGHRILADQLTPIVGSMLN